MPTHLEQLDDELAATLRHNATELRGHALEVILPETCSPSWYEAFFAEHGIAGSVRLVAAHYFGSPAAVNKMGTDPAFYRLYRDYEYMLICHLDAWIFQDRLAFWMDAGYDFIGAPLFLPPCGRTHFLQRMAPFGGNGGLSLRRVDSCFRVLETFKPGVSLRRIGQALWFLARNRRWGFIRILFWLLRELARDWRGTCQKYNIYEDVFFTVIAPLCGNRIAIPDSKTALTFACEVNYALLQKEVLRLAPPLGIHGYDKYVDADYLGYVRGFFSRKAQCYDSEPALTKPLVSVVMIVKNLITSGRAETFDQAINSVLSQTYERVEIVLLDGASTDGTFAMLQERYGHAGNIAFHCKADRSVWEGMKNGVDFATGDLISVMNSDDYFRTPYALALLVQKMTATNADMAFGETGLVTDKGTVPFSTHLPSVLYCFGVVHQATLIKRSVIHTIDPFTRGHITAENLLFVAILMGGFQVVSVPETVVHYRVGGLSTELYGGKNAEKTAQDYVRYMKTLTTIGHYLQDEEIRLLHGFSGLRQVGPVRFTRMILKVGDRRLRSLLLAGLWSILSLHGKQYVKLIVLMLIKKTKKLFVKTS
ncbi:DUF5672 family protein [Azoarcus indigens]|uniref:DUF5672 family protein n=1 Tax=Azoarcus indigens TaxID=29545 RepID=UPI00105D561F|nr:DUF5672 family protein [Azoarcus indigens]